MPLRLIQNRLATGGCEAWTCNGERLTSAAGGGRSPVTVGLKEGLPSVSRGHAFLQRFLSKRVDALALSLCFDCQSFVQLGRDTQVELAGEIAPWFKALLFTLLKCV